MELVWDMFYSIPWYSIYRVKQALDFATSTRYTTTVSTANQGSAGTPVLGYPDNNTALFTGLKAAQEAKDNAYNDFQEVCGASRAYDLAQLRQNG